MDHRKYASAQDGPPELRPELRPISTDVVTWIRTFNKTDGEGDGARLGTPEANPNPQLVQVRMLTVVS